MFELQIFVQRRRKLLVRLVALLAVVVAGVLLVLPRAGAHDASPAMKTADLGSKAMLLSSASLASEQFAVFYGPVHR